MHKIEFGSFKSNTVMAKHLTDCLNNNWITMGEKVKAFEEGFANTFGYKNSVMTSSGTTADMAALMTMYDFGAKPGDEVIVPALSFIATSNAVRAAGFKPVWVDVKRETLNINEDLIEEKITDRTVAILSVNTMGKPCNMIKLREIANKHKLFLISDSCESHLCRYQEQLMSTYADMSTYSGYIAHVVVCGEAGMVGTNSDALADILQSVRSHGRPKNSLYFNHERYGLNFKPTDLHASIGLGSLDEFGWTFSQRDKHLRQIRDKCGFLREVAYLSEEDKGDFNCPHGFSVTVKNPKDFPTLLLTLDRYGIHHKRNFGCVPTQHKAFEHEGHTLGEFPESEYVGDNGIHIGCHPYLTSDDLNTIEEAFRDFYGECQ